MRNTKKMMGNRPYLCETCGKAFKQCERLLTHVRLHTGDKPYKCQICQKSFVQKVDLYRHATVHTGERPYECPICKKTYTNRSALKVHAKTHMIEKQHKCQYCEKEFHLKGALRIHLGVHTGAGSCKCKICNKTFTRSHHLNIHMRLHTGEKPYQCETCGKSFTQLGNMHLHTRVHTGETPYKCQTCAQVFTSSVKLKNHMYVIHGEMPVKVNTNLMENSLVNKKVSNVKKLELEKPYVCKYCELAFSYDENLMMHEETCRRKKVHKCESCEESFTAAVHLKSHRTSCAGLNPYKCQYCSRRFVIDTRLITHMENIHRKISIEQSFLASRAYKKYLRNRKVNNDLRIIEREKSVLKKPLDVDETSEENKGNLRTVYVDIWNETESESSDSIEYVDISKVMILKKNDYKNSEYSNQQRSDASDNENLYTEEESGQKILEIDFDDDDVCEFCEEGFLTSNDMREHMETHNYEKSHECPICDESYKIFQNLRTHMRIHIGEDPPHICLICELNFDRRFPAINHMISHSNKCMKCKKFYICKNHLRKHIQATHLKKPFIKEKSQSLSRVVDHQYAKSVTTLPIHFEKKTCKSPEREKMSAHLDDKKNDVKKRDFVLMRSQLPLSLTMNEKKIKSQLPLSLTMNEKKIKSLLPLSVTKNEEERNSIKIDDSCKIIKYVTENDSMDNIQEIKKRSELSFFVSIGNCIKPTDVREKMILQSHFQRLQCITCGCPFQRLLNLEHHMDLHHRNDWNLFYGGGKHFGCSICLRSFHTKEATVKHFVIH